MMRHPLLNLLLLTPRQPREALRTVLNQRPLPDSAIWMVLALAAALSVLISTALEIAHPELTGASINVSSMPLVIASLSFIAIYLLAYFLTTVGTFFNGQATLPDMLYTLAWLLTFRICALMLALLVSLVSLPIYGFFALFLTILDVWISANFTSEVHRFTSTWQGVLVLVISVCLSVLVLILALAFCGPLLGLPIEEMARNLSQGINQP